MKELKGIKVLFGGSFNPPTKAHYEIAKFIIDKFEVSDFVFLPTGNVYNKPNLIDCKYRIEMLELVCDELNNASVSDYEMKQKEYLGTYKTLQDFNEYYFLMGADNFITLHSWINYPKVVIDNKFIVINRNNIDCNQYMAKKEEVLKNKYNFIFVDEFKEIDISSTKYHQTKDKNLLLDSVSNYIDLNEIYLK